MNKTRKIFTITAFIALSAAFLPLKAQPTDKNIEVDVWQTEHFVRKNLQDFPYSTLQDLYKSFFQSIFGPEHLVSDTSKVIAYIDWEITQEFNYIYPIYEPVGLNGDFIRVNLSAVIHGYISKEKLADCFIRSSQLPHKYSLEHFKDMWHQIINWIENNNLSLPNYQQDKQFIEDLLAKGEYAWVHSYSYRDYYHPHYRIVEKNIFYKEIYPLLIQK